MNVTLLARELLVGKAHLGGIVLVLGSTALYGCLALAFAARLYDSERFLDPAAERERKREGRDRVADDEPPSAGQALALFAVAFLLLWFIFVPWQKRSLVTGLLATQYLGMLGLVLVLARMAGRSFTGMVALRRPPAATLIGAALIGASAWAAVALLSEWLVPVPREVLENLRKALLPQDQGRSLLTSLLLVAVTPALCEEVLFRGVILRGLATRLAPPAAIISTGVLFGMFHLDVWRLLPTTLLGIVLSWVAFESRSLFPSIVVHLVNNGMLVTLSSLKADDRMSKLGRGASAAIFAGAVVVSGVGVYLVRRGGRTPRPKS
jgi:sodium transport system permease protein